MPRDLILTRQCLGLVTRIECLVRPLGDGSGCWTLLCAAGMAGEQPSVIKAQGPFHGAWVAESVLQGIAECLFDLGYAEALDPPIWRLHLLGELRRLGPRRCAGAGECPLRPER